MSGFLSHGGAEPKLGGCGGTERHRGLLAIWMLSFVTFLFKCRVPVLQSDFSILFPELYVLCAVLGAPARHTCPGRRPHTTSHFITMTSSLCLLLRLLSGR